MKIVYVSASEIPSVAANSVHVMEMTAAMTQHGHDVTLFCRRGDEAGGDLAQQYGVVPGASIRLLEVPKVRWIGGAIYAVRVFIAIRRMKPRPDLIYARHLYGAALASFLGPAIVYEAHASPFRSIQAACERWLFRRSRFRRLVVISRALRAWYEGKHRWLSAQRIVVAHDGARANLDIEPVMGCDGPVRTVGYVGQLHPGKGMELIEEIAPRLPEFEFLIAGGSNRQVEYWRQRIHVPNVRFMGHVPHGKLPEVFRCIDIAIAPYQRRVGAFDSRGDIAAWMSPLKVFEYMAHGRPMVVSDLPVLREILEHGRNALLARPDNADEWVARLRELASDANLRRRLAADAYQDCVRRYTWHARAHNVLSGLDD